MTDRRPTIDEILAEARVVESRPKLGLTFALFDSGEVRVFDSKTGIDLDPTKRVVGSIQRDVIRAEIDRLRRENDLSSDLDLDDYTGECDACEVRYIPASSDDHCTECGNCFEHCLWLEDCENGR